MLKLVLDRINSNAILKSSFAIGMITVLIKLMGYFEKITLAYYFGTSYTIDAYTLILSIIMSVFFFFRELIEPGFLNVFLKALNQKDNEGAWALFNKVGRSIFMVTLILSVAVFFFAKYVIHIFAPGFHGKLQLLSIDLLKYAFPATILLSISTLTNITLNAQKQFALPAAGDLVLKVSIVFVLIVLAPYVGIYAVVYGLIIGAGFKLIVHSITLYKEYSFGKVAVPKPYLVEVWRLTWPLIIGSTFSQITSLIDNIFASYMREGVVSALSYAKKIIDLPILLFPYILSIVIFPYFSELSIAKRKEELSVLLVSSLAWIILIFVPLSCFYNIFSIELIQLIFKRGAFTSYSVQITAYPLAIYAYGLVFFAIETIVVIFYFANSNTRTPIIVGVICVCENILLTYFLIGIVGYTGIVWGLVLSKATKVIILLAILKLKNVVNFATLSSFFWKTLFASSILTALFYFYHKVFSLVFSVGSLNKIIFVSLPLVLGMLLYVLLLHILKINKRLLFELN